ncbi:MAG TPA: DUF2461 domain-containing protein [Chryseolinea sp.]|nr:DUF2461 domain-containing protein [Chryseolinea sp.]
MKFDDILKFLKDLSKHNDREWFEKNKERYLSNKSTFEIFVGDVLKGLSAFDDSLGGLDPKKLTFRIYRDVRFSKDKTPYKKNMSAAFSPTGKGMGTPGYYFQIEPGNRSFLAVGLFMPTPENLSKIRQEIDYSGDRLQKIFDNRSFKKNFSRFWDEDKLKTAPKGYAKDHPYLEWLKLKSFIVEHSFKDTEVLDKNILKKITDIMRSAKPLNDFLRDAIA